MKTAFTLVAAIGALVGLDIALTNIMKLTDTALELRRENIMLKRELEALKESEEAKTSEDDDNE